MTQLRHSLLGTVAVLCCLVVSAAACTLPVFRFALDRWDADYVQLTAPPELSAKQIALLDQFKTAFPETFTWQEGKEAKAVFQFENHKLELTAAEFGKLPLEGLLDSPARQEIVRRIVRGDSIVWVFLPSGNKVEDNKQLTMLTERLEHLSKVMELPEIDPNDPTSQLGPGPKLRLGFSVLQVDPRDPKEAWFLRFLKAGDPELAKSKNEVLVFPVFGRGRVLGALRGDYLSPVGVDSVAEFLLGICSCQVKQLNPGWDLPVAVDWHAVLLAAEAAPSPQ